MTSMTSCIIGKKIGAVGSGHFVVLAICKCQNIENMLSLMAMAGGLYTPGIRSMLRGYIVFVFSVCLCVCLCLSVS